MKRILLLAVVLLSGLAIKAQDYNYSIGLRGGQSSGITGKYFFEPEKAIEGIISRRYLGNLVTALYEIQKPFHANTLSLTSLSWYYGAGAHIGNFPVNSGVANINEAFFTAGANAVLGLEYLFIGAPFTLSVDIMPFFSINPEFNAASSFLDMSLSVRYTFD